MLPIPTAYLRRTPSCPMGNRAYCATGDCPMCGRASRRRTWASRDGLLYDHLA